MTQEEIDIVHNTPKYFKTEEHRVDTHEEATVLADALFKGFATGSHQAGDRTADEAKVRIRRRHTMGDFRVVLYRAVSGTTQPSGIEDTEDTEDIAAGITTDDDAHSEKQTKSERKKAAKEAARARGRQSSADRKTNSS